jgi:hypothetical protein
VSPNISVLGKLAFAAIGLVLVGLAFWVHKLHPPTNAQ